MTTFIALALLLLAAVLGLLLWPLLARRAEHPVAPTTVSNTDIYREQLADLDAELKLQSISREQWAASRSEIERRVLEDEARADTTRPGRSPATALAIAAALPVAAIALYVWLGNPVALSPEAMQGSAAPHAVSNEQIDAMIGKLAARLESEPGDSEGWIMLARSNAALGRYGQAATAYARAAAQRPPDAQLLADYADTLAMANGRKLAGEPAALIARALAADGSNVKALALAGSLAFEERDMKRAIAYWRKALELTPADSPFAEAVRGSIAEAEGNLRAAGAAPADSAAAAKSPAGSGAALQGTVSLAASAAGKVAPEDPVFVFARAAQGSRMPLAILRKQVKDLPFAFSLDDSMAMTPETKLSGFSHVVVVARISKSGLATPQKEDLEAASQPIQPGTRGIKLEIVQPKP